MINIQFRNKVIDEFLKAGKKLTLLKGKVCLIKDWPNKNLAESEIRSHTGNLGWVLGKSDLIVDVDKNKGGVESYVNLKRDLKITLTETVSTPSGGFHVYLKIPESYQGLKFRKTMPNLYPGIDFLTEGSYCAIPSSFSKELKKYYDWYFDMFDYFDQELAQEKLIKLILKDQKSDYENFDFLEPKRSKEDVENLLNKLNPSMGHDQWVKVGMALHKWDEKQGFQLWENWSQGGENYQEGETEKRWSYFKPLDNGVGLGTLFRMAKLSEKDEEFKKVEALISNLNSLSNSEIELEVIPKLKKINMSPLNLDMTANALQTRFKKSSATTVSKKVIKDMLTEKEKLKDDVPDWCRTWVYVNTHNGYMNIKNMTIHKSESFNLENGKNIPENKNGSKMVASKYVAEKGFLKKVDKLAYLPQSEDRILNDGEMTVLNSFSKNSVPKSAETYTDLGLKAIEFIKNHIKFLCTTQENADILTQWLASQIQFTGKKILWAPIIQSNLQGTGKSILGTLLSFCLGDRNVGVVSPAQVINNHNEWATNRAVNILEELRVKGHNRYECLNALKPLITDRIIQINPKHANQYTTQNVTNYIAFTNDKDSLPLEDQDRRWWVIFVPVDTFEEMEVAVNCDYKTYAEKLRYVIYEQSDQIKKWLEEYPISEQFLKTVTAPMTDHKRIMIAGEYSLLDGLCEVEEVIKNGGQCFNELVVSSSDLFCVVEYEHPEFNFTPYDKNKILKRLGYMPHPKRIKINGKPKQMWTKKTMSAEEIKESLVVKKDNKH